MLRYEASHLRSAIMLRNGLSRFFGKHLRTQAETQLKNEAGDFFGCPPKVSEGGVPAFVFDRSDCISSLSNAKSKKCSPVLALLLKFLIFNHSGGRFARVGVTAKVSNL
jgi:hypothetical protein